MGSRVPKLSVVHTTDQAINQFQTQVKQSMNTLLDKPEMHSGTLVRIQLKAGVNDIPHGLGRTLQGWRITRQRSAGTVHDEQDANNFPDKTVRLVASAPMEVDLIVH
jgi:hypothetical protein